MIRLLDGPGVDAAAAKLRSSGLEVEVVNGPAAIQFWRFCSHRARARSGKDPTPDEKTAEHWLLLGPEGRELWRGIVAKVEGHPWIDPELLELMGSGEDVLAGESESNYARLRREGEEWRLALGSSDGEDEVVVGQQLAAAWLGEFG